MPAFSWEFDKSKWWNPSDNWRKMTSKSNSVALISASKWQKTNLQLQINPRIMNEEFSPEVLNEYFCRTHFVDNDGCFQGNKKRGVLAKSLFIFLRSPHLTLAVPSYWSVNDGFSLSSLTEWCLTHPGGDWWMAAIEGCVRGTWRLEHMKLKVTSTAKPPFSFQEDKQTHSEFSTDPEYDIPVIQSYRQRLAKLSKKKKKKKLPSGA